MFGVEECCAIRSSRSGPAAPCRSGTIAAGGRMSTVRSQGGSAALGDPIEVAALSAVYTKDT
ncbi:hypothetical protein, partial [Micromonospora tulbaghiae]|uniref:hypothetical protein n=1 Tax=Micromonospora tulbaghiae TaxID=479978 RepID=UPI00343591C9